MMTGTVLWFSEDKGYGYLVTDDGTEVFVHHANILGEGFRTLATGSTAVFEVGDDGRGPTALSVTAKATDSQDG